MRPGRVRKRGNFLIPFIANAAQRRLARPNGINVKTKVAGLWFGSRCAKVQMYKSSRCASVTSDLVCSSQPEKVLTQRGSVFKTKHYCSNCLTLVSLKLGFRADFLWRFGLWIGAEFANCQTSYRSVRFNKIIITIVVHVSFGKFLPERRLNNELYLSYFILVLRDMCRSQFLPNATHPQAASAWPILTILVYLRNQWDSLAVSVNVYVMKKFNGKCLYYWSEFGTR